MSSKKLSIIEKINVLLALVKILISVIKLNIKLSSKLQDTNQMILEEFNLDMSNVFKGEPVIPNMKCNFQFTWNYTTNTGSAKLISINNNSEIDIPLYPQGIKNSFNFMSDTAPKKYKIDGEIVVISRVILDITPYLKIFIKSAAIEFGNGKDIQTTNNYKYLNNF